MPHVDRPESLPEPTPSRPRMPEYGVPQDLDGVLPWSWAIERLIAAHNYWVSTVEPGGAPHLVPVWGVWIAEGFYFDTASTSKKARNLATYPRAVVTTERADEAVIVHGRVLTLEPGQFTDEADAGYAAKYGEAPPGQRYLVQPTHAFGFIEQAGEFGRTATRWDFD